MWSLKFAKANRVKIKECLNLNTLLLVYRYHPNRGIEMLLWQSETNGSQLTQLSTPPTIPLFAHSHVQLSSNISSQGKLLIPLMRFALCKEQTAQAKRNAICKIMVYFCVAPPTLVGWADCM